LAGARETRNVPRMASAIRNAGARESMDNDPGFNFTRGAKMLLRPP